MRSQLLIVLLAAVVSAHPIPNPHDGGIDPRELQYSDIARLSPPPEWRHGSRYYGESSRGYPHHQPEDPHPHDHDGPRDHPHDFHEFELRPRDRHHGGPGGEIVDNLVKFFSHEARSDSDVPSRVVEGIIDFLSQETRDVHEEHEHEHEHRHRPRHPGFSVINNILGFFARATR